MTAIELLASLATGGAGTVGLKSAFDYLTHRGNRTLTAEDRLWARIARLEEHQSRCDETNAALHKRVIAQDGEIAALQLQNAQQAHQIAALRDARDELGKRCNALHGELETLHKQIRK